jgi:hypothetical protein
MEIINGWKEIQTQLKYFKYQKEYQQSKYGGKCKADNYTVT